MKKIKTRHLLIGAIFVVGMLVLMVTALIANQQKKVYRSRAAYPTPTSTPYPTPIPPGGPCGNDRSCENISDATSCQNQQGIWFFQGCEDWDPETPDTKHCCLPISPTITPITTMTATPTPTRTPTPPGGGGLPTSTPTRIPTATRTPTPRPTYTPAPTSTPTPTPDCRFDGPYNINRDTCSQTNPNSNYCCNPNDAYCVMYKYRSPDGCPGTTPGGNGYFYSCSGINDPRCTGPTPTSGGSPPPTATPPPPLPTNTQPPPPPPATRTPTPIWPTLPPTYTPPVSCQATKPTNLNVTLLGANSAVLDWSPGTGGTIQYLRVGANLQEVNTGCGGNYTPACVIKRNNLTTNNNTFKTAIDEAFDDNNAPAILNPDTTYYWRIVTFHDASCYIDNRPPDAQFTTLPLPPPPSATPGGPSVTTAPPTVTPISCGRKNEGDANCDEHIDGIDYSIWLNSQCHPQGGQQCADLRADFDGNGTVDDDDYLIWYNHRNT